jgi:cytochrome c oxidase assembly protein Cox11
LFQDHKYWNCVPDKASGEHKRIGCLCFGLSVLSAMRNVASDAVFCVIKCVITWS